MNQALEAIEAGAYLCHLSALDGQIGSLSRRTTNTIARDMPRNFLICTSPVRFGVAACALLLALPSPAADYALCGPALLLPARPKVEVMPSQPGETTIESDNADLSESGVSILSGNVQVVRDTKQVSADEGRYNKATGHIQANGNLRVWDQGTYLAGSRGEFSVDDDFTVVKNARYTLRDAHAHGDAGVITVKDSQILKARDARYSTCNPDDEAWVLEADKIKLDKQEQRGLAHNVWIKFKGVPVFYSPILSFPLSDARKSGFLSPSFGLSGNSGTEISLPYYFNIAPNMDATVTARGMSDRGVQLQGEYRYLFPWGSGQIGAEALPSDSVFNDDRAALKFKHHTDFSNRLQSNLDLNWVSDKSYFEDLGSSLDISSQTHLLQSGDISYSGNGFWARTLLQNYQTIDRSIIPANRPYKRLPQFLIQSNLPERNRRINFSGRAEVVNFDRRSSITGIRWDLNPQVSFPLRSAAGYIIPRLGLRYTGYSLDGTSAGQSNSPSRIVPDFSVDGGLFLDRPFRFAGNQYTQTLEPRIHYLYRPFSNQNDLPVFDTGEYSFNFSQLFRDDRFSGADRTSDANQVTLALTTRILDKSSGDEFLHASIGQIRYFRDRKITLPGIVRDTRTGSDIVAEITANLNRQWRTSAGTQYNTASNKTSKNTLAVRYQPDTRRIMNLAYRFVRGQVEQTDISTAWPLLRNWRAVGRWNYSLKGDRTLEAFAGLEYESCCWGLRLVTRRYLANSTGEYNNGVFVQFELKGLAGVGNANEFLNRQIPGYRNEF